MGGIGKTQLAVEYVYRHKDDFPDGIFWIDAAGPLAEGFARLATDSRLRWAESDRPRDEQIRAAFVELNRRPNALLVLDNLPDPAALAVPVVPDCVPEDLHAGCCSRPGGTTWAGSRGSRSQSSPRTRPCGSCSGTLHAGPPSTRRIQITSTPVPSPGCWAGCRWRWSWPERTWASSAATCPWSTIARG